MVVVCVCVGVCVCVLIVLTWPLRRTRAWLLRRPRQLMPIPPNTLYEALDHGEPV